MDLNKAQIRGRVGQTPDVRYTKSNTAVCNLSVATSRTYKKNDGEKVDETTWHEVTLWGRLAEIAEEYVEKGSLVYIEGRIEQSQWEDEKNDVTRYNRKIVGFRLDLLGGKSDRQVPDKKGNDDSLGSDTDLDEDFDDIDDDLPF